VSKQTVQKNDASTNGTFGIGLKFAAVTAAVIIMAVFAAGTATAATMTQNVNVVNKPTVNANATITAPGPLTNVGRLASQQVMLLLAPACPSSLALTAADSTVSCFDMANYPGQVLVITDFTWSAAGGPANTTCLVGITLNHNLVYESTAVAASDTWAGKSEQFMTGLKTTVNPQIAIFSNTCTGFNGATMFGYLLPNQ